MAKSTKPSAKILQAMEVIGDRKLWTKNAIAKDKNDHIVKVNDKDAVCFCSIGALDKVKASYQTKGYLSGAVFHDNYGYSLNAIVDYNDAPETKHKDVMNLFMTAAFLALSEGK